jgi:hypothetical protein
MEFEAKTRDGFEYEILKEVKRRLVGYVIDTTGTVIPMGWLLDGKDCRVDGSGCDLVPKKLRVWIQKESFNTEKGKLNPEMGLFGTWYLKPPLPDQYIEFEQVIREDKP